MNDDLKLRYWQVYITLPPDTNKRYTRNRTVGIAALRLHDAIRLALQQYPDGEIYSAQHRGEIDLAQFPMLISEEK